ncbi:MAG: class C sortase [Tissierellia bacterium]|nr:class C sortase [Tissierellia bacterium]
MDKKRSILLKVFLIVGILIFFYPTISDFVNSFSQTTGIVKYNRALDQFDDIEIEEILAAARDYNERIFREGDALYRPEAVAGYEEQLNPFGDGMMGSICIPKIDVNLPVYHGTNEGVIQSAVGHLQGTSLPVGGPSTHAVLSTHTGLASSRLFTDLNQLVEGDQFVLSVLGQNLFYQVDQIITVLPTEVEALHVAEGRDQVTLFTCTPYGINTHRLLVRGQRIEVAEEEEMEIIEEAVKQRRILDLLKFLAIVAVILAILVSIIKDIKD